MKPTTATPSLVQRMLEIAVIAHAGQTRANGDPYIFHPLRLMLRAAGDPIQQAVNIGHDLLEDTMVTVLALRTFLGDVPGADEAIEAIQLLTKTAGQDYDVYILRVSANKYARRCKIDDLLDNSNYDELPEITEHAIRRTQKYAGALGFLKQQERLFLETLQPDPQE